MPEEPELCLDCGVATPGGGFCPACLMARIRELDLAMQRALEEKEADA